ncbi:MAG: serine hydrolase domain-containing protein [Acidimicrobiales bacterium]
MEEPVTGRLRSVTSWPVTTVAAGWIDGSGGSERIGPTDRAFPLASVTKPLAAWTMLVAIEEGTLDLDAPLGPPGSTVRHLLSHASGLGDDPDRPLTRPEQRRIYSNAGFSILGRALAERSGLPTPEYFREALVEPLGLRATRLDGSPAHAAVGSVDDLLLVAAEWLRPSLLAPETMLAARSPQFPDLIGVLPGYGAQDPNPWGLGFEVRGHKSPHWTGQGNSPATFGHFGRSGTFVWVDPVADMACVVLTDEPFGPWAVSRWPSLSDAALGARPTPEAHPAT